MARDRVGAGRSSVPFSAKTRNALSRDALAAGRPGALVVGLAGALGDGVGHQAALPAGCSPMPA